MNRDSKIPYEQLKRPSNEGNFRRVDSLKEPLKDGGFLPQPVLLKDLDEAFEEWAKNIILKGPDGIIYPTFVLFSNQRFSEYSQTWKHVDDNNNIILNFKTVTRENNPEHGKNNDGYYNIPGEQWYLMKKETVLDDNGTESLLLYEIKEPTAVDLKYKVSIFTDNYQDINQFNEKMNVLFEARQQYIFPNGHDMPLHLESISDESVYNINDRQFYSQAYQITLLGYIIPPEKMRVRQCPKKLGFRVDMGGSGKAFVEVIEDETDLETPLTYNIVFKQGADNVSFTMQDNLAVRKIEKENIYRGINYQLWVNGKKIENMLALNLYKGDYVKTKIKATDKDLQSVLKIKGKNI